MQLKDLLKENYDECVLKYLKKSFNEEYEPLFDDTEIINVLDILEKINEDPIFNNLNLKNLNKKAEFFKSSQDELYILRSEKLHASLSELYQIIDDYMGNGETTLYSIDEIVKAIKDYFKIVEENSLTFDEWIATSKSGKIAQREADEVCSEPSDPYKRYGVKPSDFF